MALVMVEEAVMVRRKAGGAYNVSPTTPGTYGDFVRRCRIEHGWTQDELAERLEAWMRVAMNDPTFNYTQNALSALERSKGSPNRRLMHEAFAAVFGLQPAEFILRSHLVIDPGLDLKLRGLTDEQRRELDAFITARYYGEAKGDMEIIEDDGTIAAFVELLEQRPTAEELRRAMRLIGSRHLPERGADEERRPERTIESNNAANFRTNTGSD
jgi:transcriptional regulator with XRE-family HTH domain